LNFVWVERIALTLSSIFSWPTLVVAIISSCLAHTAASIFPWIAFIPGPQLFMASTYNGFISSWSALMVAADIRLCSPFP
jgi:hypothetical protein